MSGAIYEAGQPPLRKLPVLLVHGTEDDMIPLFAAQRTRLVLEENGVGPEYHEFPMGHQVTNESMLVVRNFLRRVLI
jgi:phospholipase/carboxylesterase